GAGPEGAKAQLVVGVLHFLEGALHIKEGYWGSADNTAPGLVRILRHPAVVGPGHGAGQLRVHALDEAVVQGPVDYRDIHALHIQPAQDGIGGEAIGGNIAKAILDALGGKTEGADGVRWVFHDRQSVHLALRRHAGDATAKARFEVAVVQVGRFHGVAIRID